MTLWYLHKSRLTTKQKQNKTTAATAATAVVEGPTRANTGKRKAKELDLSNSGGSLEPASRRPAPGPLSGAKSPPLPAPAKVHRPDGPSVAASSTTASTSEQATSRGRQLGSYAEVSAAYTGASQEVKGVRDVKSSRGPSPAHHAALKPPSGTVQPSAKRPGSQPGPASSMEEARGRRSPRVSGDLSGPLTGVSSDAASSSHAQVDKTAPGERRNKTPVYVSGVKDVRGFLHRIRAELACGIVAQMKGDLLTLVPETADGFRAT
ncbi:mucin-1-like, partial [Zootermopsis nevadensis]|uniref:mucin-1-like n=1 Tax=Zootermopsis nevadensis TaxID=136037 RepID=UPI000B8ED843